MAVIQYDTATPVALPEMLVIGDTKFRLSANATISSDATGVFLKTGQTMHAADREYPDFYAVMAGTTNTKWSWITETALTSGGSCPNTPFIGYVNGFVIVQAVAFDNSSVLVLSLGNTAWASGLGDTNSWIAPAPIRHSFIWVAGGSTYANAFLYGIAAASSSSFGTSITNAKSANVTYNPIEQRWTYLSNSSTTGSYSSTLLPGYTGVCTTIRNMTKQGIVLGNNADTGNVIMVSVNSSNTSDTSYSADGIAFSDGTQGTFSGEVPVGGDGDRPNIVWGKGRFATLWRVTSADGELSRILVSTDGTTWTTATTAAAAGFPTGLGSWNAAVMVYQNNRFWVRGPGNAISWSWDCVTWNHHIGYLSQVTEANGRLIGRNNAATAHVQFSGPLGKSVAITAQGRGNETLAQRIK